MKAESIMAHVNMCYQKGEIPLEIKELHIYHPTYDPNGHDDLLQVNPDVRLDGCAMLLIEVRVYRRKEDRYYEYQIRCRNNAMAGFEPTEIILQTCDIFPGENPVEIENEMKNTMDNATDFLLNTLQLLSE